MEHSLGSLGPFLEKGSKLFSIFFPSAKSSVGFEVCLGWTSRPHRTASVQPPFQGCWELSPRHSPGLASSPPSLHWSHPQDPNWHQHPRPQLAEPNGGQGNRREGRQQSRSKEILHVGKSNGTDVGKAPVIHNLKVWLREKLGFPKQ